MDICASRWIWAIDFDFAMKVPANGKLQRGDRVPELSYHRTSPHLPNRVVYLFSHILHLTSNIPRLKLHFAHYSPALSPFNFPRPQK